MSERSCAGQLGNARRHACAAAQRLRRGRARAARSPRSARRRGRRAGRAVEGHRANRARMPCQVDLGERRAVRDPVDVEPAVAERGANRLEVVARPRAPVLRRIAVQRRETGVDHRRQRRRPGRGSAHSSWCEPPVPRWSTSTMSRRSRTRAPDARHDGGRVARRGAARPSREIGERVPRRGRSPGRQDDHARPMRGPETGFAILRNDERAAPRLHALHDALPRSGSFACPVVAAASRIARAVATTASRRPRRSVPVPASASTACAAARRATGTR